MFVGSVQVQRILNVNESSTVRNDYFKVAGQRHRLNERLCNRSVYYTFVNIFSLGQKSNSWSYLCGVPIIIELFARDVHGVWTVIQSTVELKFWRSEWRSSCGGFYVTVLMKAWLLRLVIMDDHNTNNRMNNWGNHGPLPVFHLQCTQAQNQLLSSTLFVCTKFSYFLFTNKNSSQSDNQYHGNWTLSIFFESIK